MSSGISEDGKEERMGRGREGQRKIQDRLTDCVARLVTDAQTSWSISSNPHQRS